MSQYFESSQSIPCIRQSEELGEIVKSNPSVQDIEDEKFEFEFCIIMFSQEELEKVTKSS